MSLIIFDCKGIPATRRERIEIAVVAGGKHVKEPYEGLDCRLSISWRSAGGHHRAAARRADGVVRFGRRSGGYSPNGSGRLSRSDGIVGFLLDSTTDKMRDAV